MLKSETTVTVVSDGRTRPPPATFVVLVAKGPNTGQRVFFDGRGPSVVSVGQSPMCELRLDDPRVSRRHCTLAAQADGLVLRDEGSTNGTYLGPARVREVVLRGGSEFRLGDTVLQVLEVAGEPEVQVPPATGYHRIVGESVLMRRLYPVFAKAAAAAAPLLVEGETGTGKELLAECLHETGPRAAAPFVVVDSANLVDTVAFARLFGDATTPGAFASAEGGTIVFDEVASMPKLAQTALLGVLSRGSYPDPRVGAPRPANVRVMALSSTSCEAAVEAGALREDLLYRLAVLRIDLPPLRARPDDVVPLARTFHARLTGSYELPPDLLARLDVRGGWPGNVRQLEALVLRHHVTGTFGGGDDAPRPVAAGHGHDAIETILEADRGFSETRELVLAEFERRYVDRALRLHGGNATRAAAASGLARRYFQIVRSRHKV